MFVDTSVVMALLAGDPDAVDFAVKLDAAKLRYTSSLVCLEASMHLSTLLDIDPTLVEAHVKTLLDEADIRVISISAGIASKAVAAFEAYGQGRGHPAQLTLSQCMSYACAQAYRVPLLFKIGGFALTDVTAA